MTDHTPEREWWHPRIVDASHCERLRKDYPEDAHLDDESLREEYECSAKYAVLWDHVGDAYEQFEKLADDWISMRKHLAGINPEAVPELMELAESVGGMDCMRYNKHIYPTLCGVCHSCQARKVLQAAERRPQC